MENKKLKLLRKNSEDLLQDIKGLLKTFFSETRIWQMVPNCSELLVVSKDLSVKSAIDILAENNANYCMLINQKKHEPFALFVLTDFINFILSLENTNSHLINDEKEALQVLRQTTIGELLEKYHKYSEIDVAMIFRIEVV